MVCTGRPRKGVEPPPVLQGSVEIRRPLYPSYRLFLVALSALVAVAVWAVPSAHAGGARHARGGPEQRDGGLPRARTCAACARWSSGGVRLAGLGGVAAAPMTTAYLGMGISVIVEAFIVVVIGGLG